MSLNSQRWNNLTFAGWLAAFAGFMIAFQPTPVRSGQAPAYALALELLDEGDWRNCRRECLRLMVRAPEDPTVQCIAAMAAMGAGLTNQIPRFDGLSVDAAVRRRVESFSRRPVRQPFMVRVKSIAAAPCRWMILFYRSQIGPAIGQRCQLKPSCSEYSYQALTRHGLMGLPMTADRLLREPSVNGDAKVTVTTGKEVFVRDPVSDHDYWWTPAGKPAFDGGQRATNRER